MFCDEHGTLDYCPECVKADVSVERMAELFWEMGSNKQADFFHYLGVIAKKHDAENENSYGMCEMQWCYMAGDIKERSPEARDMYMALSSFAFDYWPRKASMEVA